MKKKLLIAIIAVVIAVAIPVTAFVILGGQDDKTRPEKDKTAEQYVALESAAFHEVINTLLSDNIEIGTFEPEKIAATGKVDISLSDNILALLGAEDATFADLGLPNTLTSKTSIYIDGLKQKMVIDLLLNGQNIVSGNMISDPTSGVSYLAIPTISNYWLKAQNTSTQQMPDVSALMDGLTEIVNLLPTLREPANKYIDLALAQMKNVDKGTETISIGGQSKTVTVYTNYITEKVAMEIVKAVLTEAKTDSTLKSLLPADLNFEATADMLLNSLPEDPSNDKEDAIVLKLYVDENNKAVGRSLAVADDVHLYYFASAQDKAAELGFKSRSNGFTLEINSNGATIYAIDGNVSIKLGSLTFTGDEKNGSVKLMLSKTVTNGSEDTAIICKWASADDKFTLTLALESGAASTDLGYLIISGDESKGSVELKLADAIENALFGSADADLSLLCDWDAGDPSTNAKMNLSLMGNQLISFRFYDFNDIEFEEIVLPSNALDVTNSNAMDAFVNSLNLNTLRQNLLNAGIPAQLVDAIFASANN